MEESDLFLGGTGQIDKARIKRVNTTFCEVFEKATKCDEVIALSEGGKPFVILVVIKTIKAKTVFAKKFRG